MFVPAREAPASARRVTSSPSPGSRHGSRRATRRRGLAVGLIALLGAQLFSFGTPLPAAAADTGWIGSGTGTTTTVRDGTGGLAEFQYAYTNAANTGASGAWTFSTTADTAERVRLDWSYTGFHAFFQVTVGLQAVVIRGGSPVTTVPLVAEGPASCCTPPSSGFAYSGTTELDVQAGDTYGFTMSGSNFDSNSTLNGTLRVGMDIVINGGFEQQAVVNVARFDGKSAGDLTITGWTVGGDSVDHIGGYWNAAEGLQSIDLDGAAPGSLTQTMTTIPGQLYRLTFSYSANPDRPSTSADPSMNVEWGGTVAGSFTHAKEISTPLTWSPGELLVAATGSSTTLSFVSTDLPPGEAFGIALDAVTVVPVISGGSDFTIGPADPATLTVVQGTSVDSSIPTSAVSGSDPIGFSAVVTPPGQGVIATLSPGTVTPGTAATLTISAAEDAVPGAYSVTVTGDNGSATHATSVAVGVPAPGGAPALFRAVPQGDTNVFIAGLLSAAAATTYNVSLATSASCTNGVLDAPTTLATMPATTDANGDSYFGGSVTIASGSLSTYVAARVVPPGATSALGPCIVTSLDNDAWPRALDISGTGASSGWIDDAGRARWYKVAIQPGSRVNVTLSNLPADYDLFLFKDIGQAFTTLTGTSSLTQLSAEFAPSAYSPSAYSPSAYSPSAYSPSAFSPSAYSPSAFSPSVYSPSAFSPSAYSPSAYSPSAYSPSAFSPSAYSPSAFSPSAYSPSAYSPSAFSPESFSSAQTRSLIGVSAGTGTAPETLVADTWNNTGYFYIRVSGKNGASSLASPFQLTVTVDGNLCAGVNLVPPEGFTAPAGAYRTLVLWDSSRMPGPAADVSSLQAKLATFAGRPEIAGAIEDLAGSARVRALNAQADANPSCVWAKNLVASGIRDIVTAYRAANPGLQYVVLVGDDGVIPFFRYPDQGLLAPESDYVPPVDPASASEASLRSNYVLGQDAYGTTTELSLRVSTFPVPDLAVGRLIETAAEASGMIDAYLATTAGVTPTPTTSLVTGYDFLEDAANSVRDDLNAGIGSTGDALITPNNVSPTAGWTATQLKNELLGERHDLIFLAGHFSANNTLAADFSTTVNSTDLVASTVNLVNSIVLSTGCHAGYNIVDGDALPGVTQPLDWAQAFAQKGATLISGTGYQYGDTDFIEYSERIYAEVARQLRLGSDPVSVGEALIRAKQVYLATTPDVRGLHEKALLETALFGLPMLKVDMPAGRIPAPSSDSIVGSTSAFATDPGTTLGLQYADLSLDPIATSPTNVSLNTLDPSGVPNGSVLATYYRGRDGVVTNPGEPALPLQSENVTVPGTVLRGVGFMGGTYQDSSVVPLTGAAAVEVRGVHSAFSSTAFYPMRPWSVNYFDALDPAGGATRLLVTPAQHRVDAIGDQSATLRLYGSLGLRLFYSAYTGDAAQSAAPTISGVSASASGQDVAFRATVTGNPAAGIQQVWIVYTGTGTGPSGVWAPVFLVQDPSDSTLWTGTLQLPAGESAANLRFMAQAVNGVGLVTLDDNLGAYYDVSGSSAATPDATSVTLDPGLATGTYGSSVAVGATLTSGGNPVAGESIVFTIGATTRVATTDSNGRAGVPVFPLTSVPGTYQLTASFAGDGSTLPGGDSRSFSIARIATSVVLSGPGDGQFGTDSGVVATLSDANGAPLGSRTVFFVLSGASGARTTTATTDFAGRAPLGTITLPVGQYEVGVYFNGLITLLPSTTSISITDATYEASSATASYEITRAGQVVRFTSPPPASAVYGGTYVPSATGGGSGNPVTFGARGACTYSSPTVTFNGVGTCTVTANQAGNADYEAAPEATQSFPVRKQASLGFTGNLFWSTGTGTSTNVTLKGKVTAAAMPSVSLAQASIDFLVFASGNATTTPNYTCPATVTATGDATCTRSLTLDNWTVIMRIRPGSPYFTAADSDPVVLTVYRPTSGRYAIGAGWVVDPSYLDRPVAVSSSNRNGAFGFAVSYKADRRTPQGQVEYAFRGADGYNYLITSTSWTGGGLSFGSGTASFSGKASVTVINPATGTVVRELGGTAFTYRVDVRDGSPDTFAMSVFTSGGALYHRVGTTASPIAIGGGGIIVR